MGKPLRFTGEWPPCDLFDQYPNWENALDEEDFEGQDETTLRPSYDQREINEFVTFSAADVTFSDGRNSLGILEIGMVEIGMDVVSALNILIDGQWFRLLRQVDQFNQLEGWVPWTESWLEESERSPVLEFDDRFFPLRFVSRLPHYKSGAPISARILRTGAEELP